MTVSNLPTQSNEWRWTVSIFHSPPLVGKFDTVIWVGIESAHQVGILDTVWNLGLQIAHFYFIVAKFETVTKVCIQFAHLPYLVGKLDTDLDESLESAHSV